MLNRVTIMGRLVRDPELRRTQSGTAVASFRIAADRDFKNQDGTRQADFFDVVAWRSTAEYICKYFTKGRMAVVSGRLQSRSWTDQDGGKRVSIEIVADSVYFGDSKREGDNGLYGSTPAPRVTNQSGGFTPPAYPVPGPSGFEEIGEEDGKLPF